jgi:hypothetical protein
MRTNSRARTWFYIVVLPLAVVIGLSGLLRYSLEQSSNAAAMAEVDRLEREASAMSAEKEAEKQSAQRDYAQRCGRLARSMMQDRNPGDALLVVVTPQPCAYSCGLVEQIEQLVIDNGDIGVRGVWVQTRQADSPPAEGSPLRAMEELVIGECADFLGLRRSDFIVLDGDGQLVHGGLGAGPVLHEGSPEAAIALREAVRKARPPR